MDLRGSRRPRVRRELDDGPAAEEVRKLRYLIIWVVVVVVVLLMIWEYQQDMSAGTREGRECIVSERC